MRFFTYLQEWTITPIWNVYLVALCTYICIFVHHCISKSLALWKTSSLLMWRSQNCFLIGNFCSERTLIKPESKSNFSVNVIFTPQWNAYIRFKTFTVLFISGYIMFYNEKNGSPMTLKSGKIIYFLGCLCVLPISFAMNIGLHPSPASGWL